MAMRLLARRSAPPLIRVAQPVRNSTGATFPPGVYSCQVAAPRLSVCTIIVSRKSRFRCICLAPTTGRAWCGSSRGGCLAELSSCARLLLLLLCLLLYCCFATNAATPLRRR